MNATKVKKQLKKVSPGIYRLESKIVLYRREASELSHSVVKATRKCFIWVVVGTSYDDEDLKEALSTSLGRRTFQKKVQAIYGEFETLRDAVESCCWVGSPPLSFGQIEGAVMYAQSIGCLDTAMAKLTVSYRSAEPYMATHISDCFKQIKQIHEKLKNFKVLTK